MMSYNTQAGSLQYSFVVFKVPLKSPLNDKEPSDLTVALCGILTRRPLTLYARLGTDLKISASNLKAASDVLLNVDGSKTNSVIDVNSKAFDNYDYILTSGPHHDKEIKQNEKIAKRCFLVVMSCDLVLVKLSFFLHQNAKTGFILQNSIENYSNKAGLKYCF